MLADPSGADFVRENSMFMVYAGIPPRVVPGEVLAITVFGIFSSLIASWIASRNVLKMTVAEVMRDE
jgi:lipoprotein-releasing system permease protein